MPISPAHKYLAFPRSLLIFFSFLQIPLQSTHIATELSRFHKSNMGCFCSKNVVHETERAARPVSISRRPPSTPVPWTNEFRDDADALSLGNRAPGVGKRRVRLPPPEMLEFTRLPQYRHPRTNLLTPVRVLDGKAPYWEYDGGSERIKGCGPLPNARRVALQEGNPISSGHGEVLGGRTVSF